MTTKRKDVRVEAESWEQYWRERQSQTSTPAIEGIRLNTVLDFATWVRGNAFERAIEIAEEHMKRYMMEKNRTCYSCNDPICPCVCFQDEHHRDCPAIKVGCCHFQSLYNKSVATQPTDTSERFTNGKRWIATEKDCIGPWSAQKNGEGFRCGMCNHKFVPGEGVRWVYANGNSPSYGNFLTCDSCDGPDVLQRRTAAGEFAKALNFDDLLVAVKAISLHMEVERLRAVEHEHYVACNASRKVPIGTEGAGCICVVTYRRRLNELEAAERRCGELVEGINLALDVTRYLEKGDSGARPHLEHIRTMRTHLSRALRGDGAKE